MRPRTPCRQCKEGSVQVEDGVGTAIQAGESLEQIIKMAERVGGMITQIATASTQQFSTTEQVKGNIGQIAQLIKESAAGAQQSSQACRDLSTLAFDLRKVIDGFQLEVADQRPLQLPQGHAARGSSSMARAAGR